MYMLACLAKPHPLFHISTSSVCVRLNLQCLLHTIHSSLILFVCAVSSCINHHVTRSNKQFLTLCRFLNDHGGWCRHTAKWWNGCLGVWGPADQSGPGKFCKEKRFKIHTLHSTFQSGSEVLLLRDACEFWIKMRCAYGLQASIAAAQVSSSSPTVTLVQLPNGQTVQVHGVIQAAQPSVIQSPQVQTVQVWEI